LSKIVISLKASVQSVHKDLAKNKTSPPADDRLNVSKCTRGCDNESLSQYFLDLNQPLSDFVELSDANPPPFDEAEAVLLKLQKGLHRVITRGKHCYTEDIQGVNEENSVQSSVMMSYELPCTLLCFQMLAKKIIEEIQGLPPFCRPISSS